jgi:arsenite methyltransferase
MTDGPHIRAVVRTRYGEIAKGTSRGCCGPECCGGAPPAVTERKIGEAVGYSSAELAAVPEGANLGLGCGNPLAHAAVRPGDTVLDLGSGAGMDAFLAAREVGPSGRVIGVDMTPEMVERGRENARRVGATNVEFRLGEIERLPVADASVDVIISNCVINLSPDKPRVFREIARVLRPGGRVALSDMVLLQPLPDALRGQIAAYVGCVAGAVLLDEYLAGLRAAGLTEVTARPKAETGTPLEGQASRHRLASEDLPAGARPEDFVVSVDVRGVKLRP